MKYENYNYSIFLAKNAVWQLDGVTNIFKPPSPDNQIIIERKMNNTVLKDSFSGIDISFDVEKGQMIIEGRDMMIPEIKLELTNAFNLYIVLS